MSFDVENAIAGIITGLVVVASFIFFIFWGAFVFATLWQWFVIPATGFAAIGYWHAAGLSLTVSFIRLKLTTYEPSGKKIKNGPIIFQAIFIPFFVLALGWVIKTFAGL